MELQGRILSTNMTGDDVALLHVELQKLGFRLQTTEIKKRRFGRTTGETVRAFQKRHDLPVTGKVDERTVTLINREVEALETRPFVVRGSVKNMDNKPLSVVVRAFDKDLRAEQLLGEAQTDAKGLYRIEHSKKHFIRAYTFNGTSRKGRTTEAVENDKYFQVGGAIQTSFAKGKIDQNGYDERQVCTFFKRDSTYTAITQNGKYSVLVSRLTVHNSVLKTLLEHQQQSK